MRNLEVLQLVVNLKTGGLDIAYAESVSMKVEKHKVSFPHRPKKELVNAIRQLSLHVPFLCEFDILTDFDNCSMKEDEKGLLPELFENCQAIGFAIRVKDDTEVKLFGRKKLEFSDKFMDLTTPYFVVSDSSQYEYNKELSEVVSNIQILSTDYIDGDYDKTGTQYDIFQGGEVIMKREKKVEESDSLLLKEQETFALEEHQEKLLPQYEPKEEDEAPFPENLESFEEDGDEELPKPKKNKKSSNLKPKKK